MRSLAFLYVYAVALFAQTTGSTLTGALSDPSGAIVADAGVTVTNEDTGVAISTQTNSQGLYRVTPLSPGTYTVDVQSSGFQRLQRKGVIVQVSQTVQLDLSLTVGNVTETVAVTAAAPLLDAQTSSTGQVIERQMIEGMPLPNRSATALVVLTPGAVVQSQGGGGESIPIFSVHSADHRSAWQFRQRKCLRYLSAGRSQCRKHHSARSYRFSRRLLGSLLSGRLAREQCTHAELRPAVGGRSSAYR